MALPRKRAEQLLGTSMVRLGDRLAQFSVLIIAALIVTEVALGADRFAQAKSPQKPSDAIACLMPKKGNPAVACYAAMLTDGKLPHKSRESDRFSLPNSDILVLGEIHDNWVHHALRARMVAAFAKARRGRTAVVMEHIRSDKAEALAQHQASIDRTKPEFWKAAAVGLGPALDWKKSGWPAWSDFQPIAEAAFKAGVPIYAGDVPRAKIRNVARKGMAALTKPERTELGLDKPLPTRFHDALLAQLEASHCGLMPKSAFGTMADAQRLRDAALAHEAVTVARKHGSAIILTGNGHARADRGAPSYIRVLAPDLKVVSIAFVEAPNAAVASSPNDLIPRTPNGAPVVDGLVVTGRIERPDPCEKLRQRFKKRRN